MIPSPYTHHQEEGHLLMKFYDDGVIFDVKMTEEQIELLEEILEELKDDLEE